jgi:hypothetical protein
MKETLSLIGVRRFAKRQATLSLSPRILALAVAMVLALASRSSLEAAMVAEEAGGASLGERGDLDRIEFEGVTTFTGEALRQGLAQNAGFLLASHPQAPLDRFLETLQQKVLTGYQKGGFPLATVTTSLEANTGKVRLRISEGPRYRCGMVRVTGAEPALATALITRLTKPPKPSANTAVNPASSGKNTQTAPKDSNQTDVHFNTEAHVTVQTHQPREALAATRKPSDDEPCWAPGEPAEFGKAAELEIEDAVKDCLAEHGLFFPQIQSSTKLNPETSTADLFVRVLDKGPRGTVGEIQVRGNQKNTSEEIVKFLGLKRGMAITRSRVVEAERKLWRSARFLHYEIVPEPAGPGLSKATNVRLSIKVEEYAAAPKLVEPLSAQQQVLLQFCDWVSNFEARPEDLALSGAFASESDPFHMAADIFVSPQAGLLIKISEPTPSAATDYALLFARETLGLYAVKRGCKFFITQPDLATEAGIRVGASENDPEHPFNLTFRAGWRHLSDTDRRLGTYPPFRLDLDLAPAAFLHILDDTNLAVELKSKQLAIVSSNLVVKLDRSTGRLQEFSLHGSNSWLALRFANGAFERARRELAVTSSGWTNRCDPDHPVSSMIAFASLELLSRRMLDRVMTNLPPARRQYAIAAANRLLSSTVLAPVDQSMSNTNQPEPFLIPSDDADRALAQNSLSAFFAAFGFRYCNELFPKYSWPWTIAREAVFVSANQTSYTSGELNRLYESEETGPIGCLVIAKLLAKLNSPAARTFAVRGLTRLTSSDFRRDCALLLQGDSRLARAFANVAAVLREMPDEEVEALAAALPANEAALLKESVQALRASPSAPLAEAIGPAIEKYWSNSLRAQVRAALQEIPAAPGGPRI